MSNKKICLAGLLFCLLFTYLPAQNVFSFGVSPGLSRVVLGNDKDFSRFSGCWSTQLQLIFRKKNAVFSAELGFGFWSKSYRFRVNQLNNIFFRQESVSLSPGVGILLKNKLRLSAALFMHFPNYSSVELQSRVQNGQLFSAYTNYEAGLVPTSFQAGGSLCLSFYLNQKQTWSLNLSLLQFASSFLSSPYAFPAKQVEQGSRTEFSADNRPTIVTAGLYLHLFKGRKRTRTMEAESVP